MFLLGITAGSGGAVAAGSTLLVVSHWSSPWVKFYDVDNTYAVLADPVVLPFPNGGEVAISPDGVFIVLTGGDTSPYIKVYTLSDLAFVATPSVAPTGSVTDGQFSPDSSLFVCSHATTPFMTIYNTNNWSKVSNPGTIPTGTGRGVAFNPAGTTCVIAHSTSPYITIYTVSGWSKVTNPSSLPAGTGSDVAFNHNGTELCVIASSTMKLYDPSDWSVNTNPASLPNGNTLICEYNHDGTILAIGSTSSPFITLYDTSDYTKISNPGTLPAGKVSGIRFSDDDTLLALGHNDTPYVTIYNTGDWSKVTNPGTLPAGHGEGVSFFNGALPVVAALIAQGTGSAISGGTGGVQFAGVLFDGTTAVAEAACFQSSSGTGINIYAGKDYSASAKKISYVKYWGSSDAGFRTTTPGNITITLRGANSSFPGVGGGTSLGTLSTPDTQGFHFIQNMDNAQTAWDYVWIEATGFDDADTVLIAEVEFWGLA